MVHLNSVYAVERRKYIAQLSVLRDPTSDRYNWDELSASNQEDAVSKYKHAKIGPPVPHLSENYTCFIDSLQYCKPLIAGFGLPLYNKFNRCPCSSCMAGYHTMYNLRFMPICKCKKSMEPNELVQHFQEHKDGSARN